MEKTNKLIAEFMGMKYSDKRSFNDGEWTHSIRSLSKFQSSWDWLMPVIDKCYQEHMSKHIADAVMTCNIDEVYQVVVNFIKEQLD
jgi:hypothetical protein